MAEKQSKIKNIKDAENVEQEDTPVQLCVLPEANLRAVYDWLESDSMIMPYSQVKKCLQLLGTAKIVSKKDDS